ncbi:MAG: aminoacyl-tRNA hydrolase [Alphaproteobacteria bacterium]|nr:aminoacyl-tRNA hydrolase [Alphaproteobacteria bacterium]
MQENKPVLIVGLGNPGKEYENTRHNVGFMAVDAMIPADSTWKTEKQALTTQAVFNGKKCIFVKPQTFMNNSGESVSALMKFYKIPIENLIVFHDDMDLKVGTWKTKTGGGSAGHNGIKSIDALVGNDYVRYRIGIGHPRDFNSMIDPVDWVLGKFDKEQKLLINQAITNCLTCIQL